jgi:enoyl-CoA hydratase/carnithine racemase
VPPSGCVPRPITIAVTRSSQVLASIADAADMSLAYRADERNHDHGGTVGCADPRTHAQELLERITHTPRAALTLTWLLRSSVGQPVADALVAESCAYSMLLGSTEFRRWLAARRPARPAGPTDRVRLHRSGDQLTIALARPDRRNAVDARMRDALADALGLAEADTSLHVTLTGDGPSFSAGGDIDEFGTAGDPATAHLVRVVASPAAVPHRISELDGPIPAARVDQRRRAPHRPVLASRDAAAAAAGRRSWRSRCRRTRLARAGTAELGADPPHRRHTRPEPDRHRYTAART